MDVHGVAELTKGGAEGDVGCHFLHQVGGVSAEDVGAEDATLVGLGAQFDHSFRFIHRKGFAVGAIEGFVALIGCTLFLQLVLAGPYAGGFG